MASVTLNSEKPLIDLCGTYLPEDQVNLVIEAFHLAQIAHAPQKRKSGELYIWHPVTVAYILAKLKLDAETIMAALLHDVVEDTPFTHDDLVQKFGSSLADIVDGVTKLGKAAHAASPEEAQAENLQKMLLAMTQDIRVILIKLADRLHNMRTLGVMRPEKQKRIARETLDIFAPIAARLGLNHFRTELEDLGFKAHNPMRYAALHMAMKKAAGHRKEIVDKISQVMRQRFDEAHLHHFSIQGREKHLYGLYKKMKYKHLSFNEVQDIYAFRILTDSNDDCYRVLGFIHSLYKPIPQRFKDYIAIPKNNGYQSLHTVVFGPYGVRIEVQIRTHDMHRIAEQGIAAHWFYKNGNMGESAPVNQKAQEWLKGLVEMKQFTGNSVDFLESVKVDLFPSNIFVFTPKGDIKTLPKGATALDFAYAVHSDIGHRAAACKIDKKWAPLQTQLENGNTVEIIQSTIKRPNPRWLSFVTTPKARNQIRTFLKNQQGEEAIELGRKLLDASLRDAKLDYTKIEEVQRQQILQKLKISHWDALLQEIGLGNRIPQLVVSQLVESFDTNTAASIIIHGTEGMVVNFANCCHPIPGDHIVSVFNPGKGLVIHRNQCPNMLNTQKAKIEVYWAEDTKEDFFVGLEIKVKNRPGVLADIASRISQANANIEKVNTEDKDETLAVMNFVIRVKNRQHLAQVMRLVKSSPQTLKITRN